MYPSWIDPVMRLRLTREHAAELRNDWMVANGSSLERARQVDADRGDADGKMLARLTRLVAALAARRKPASDEPCR
jgi:hypothetical protein